MDRSEFLQVARFGAALLVVVTHATFYVKERVSQGFDVWHFGEIGVPIFFAISGLVMVISTSNSALGASGAKGFLIRRLIRIVPLYWLATGIKVAIALAAPGVVNHNHFQLTHALQSFLFIPYFNSAGELRPMHGVGWTLLHEAFFYVLFALCMAVGRRPVFVASATITLACILGMMFDLRSALLTVVTSSVNMNFVVGMLLGSLVLKTESSAYPTTRRAALIAGAAVVDFLVGAVFGWGSTPFLIGLVSILMFVLLKTPMPRLRLFQKFGDSSYSLYLFHPFLLPALLIVLAKPLGQSLWVLVAISTLLAVVGAHLIHLWIEVPTIRWLKARIL